MPLTTMSPYSFATHSARGQAQRGLSLVELTIGLGIGLILTLGLFTLIGNQSSAFKTQDNFARMQENGAAALRYIGDSVRMAGFHGYTMDPANINTTIGGVTMSAGPADDCGSATNPPTSNWALDVAKPVYGFTGIRPGAVNARLPCILAANFLDVLPGGQQLLITRSTSGSRIPDTAPLGDLTADVAAQPNYRTRVYLQGDPNAGLLFYGRDFAALKAATTTRVFPNGNDIDIFEYRAHVYYLRPCSRPAGGGANCTGAGDDGGHPIPTLVRHELTGSAGGPRMTEVPLVEGIERIDFRFGIDTTNDGIADSFTATPLSAADWANVVAVKVSVLVRSPTLSAQQDDSAKSYDLDGDGAPDYKCADFLATDPNACRYKRKVFSQTFQLRNIAQRRGA
jgi:type IV pilus assembly protein PilW